MRSTWTGRGWAGQPERLERDPRRVGDDPVDGDTGQHRPHVGDVESLDVSPLTEFAPSLEGFQRLDVGRVDIGCEQLAVGVAGTFGGDGAASGEGVDDHVVVPGLHHPHQSGSQVGRQCPFGRGLVSCPVEAHGQADEFLCPPVGYPQLDVTGPAVDLEATPPSAVDLI